MIKLENYEVLGWEHAIRGMRNPMNSWEKSDSHSCKLSQCSECEYFNSDAFVNEDFKHMCARPNKDPHCEYPYVVGPNDHELMMKLSKGGPVHGKYKRMIVVYLDITAPLYWWKEFDTYKVGTVANSCSTMHKIHAKEFTLDDFRHEHLKSAYKSALGFVIGNLNIARLNYLETKDKDDWWQMIQLLPTSYNQKRTVMLNYEVLTNIYESRKNHKLDEWREFCKWIERLPYSELITGGKEE